MHFHGRIYATAQGIFFYSKLFGRERKLSLGYATIRSIQPPHGVLRSIIIHTGTTISFLCMLWIGSLLYTVGIRDDALKIPTSQYVNESSLLCGLLIHSGGQTHLPRLLGAGKVLSLPL